MYVYDVRNTNRLSAEVHTEMFRSLTSDAANLVYNIWPEASAGFSGFLHMKMWLQSVGIAHTNHLNLVVFCTDSCSTGVSAARMLTTPTDELVQKGVTYTGLDVHDYRYFDP